MGGAGTEAWVQPPRAAQAQALRAPPDGVGVRTHAHTLGDLQAAGGLGAGATTKSECNCGGRKPMSASDAGAFRKPAAASAPAVQRAGIRPRQPLAQTALPLRGSAHLGDDGVVAAVCCFGSST